MEVWNRYSQSDFDVVVVETPASHGAFFGAPDFLAGFVDHGNAAHLRALFARRGKQVHSVHDGERCAPDVDGLTAGAHGACTFDQRGRKALLAQPVSQCGAGNACAGDEDRLHDETSVLLERG